MMQAPRGMSLIDVVVGVAMMSIAFTGLSAAFQLSLASVSAAKGEAGANTLVTSEMEYVRSLPYASVGLVGGTPAGVLNGVVSQNLNSIRYITTTNVWYASTTAYKIISIASAWQNQSGSHSVSAVSYVAP